MIARIISVSLFLFFRSITSGAAYDPLSKPEDFRPRFIDTEVKDNSRDRNIPIRIYLPASKKPAPVVIFSHGLGGSRQGNAFMGEHWSARGYVVVFTQHPGSDISVWKDVPLLKRMSSMKEAANGKNLIDRIKDIHCVIDALQKFNADDETEFKGRMDLSEIGMSGHSFGALTTQCVSGQMFRVDGKPAVDIRIKAATMFSPGAPPIGGAVVFDNVKIPWLLMTGTKDVSIIGNATVESRLAVFPALPPGDKYELVLNNAEHSAFTDRALPGDREERNPNHHRAILAISTAYWDTYLKHDPSARRWLNQEGPSTVLESKDHWQKK